MERLSFAINTNYDNTGEFHPQFLFFLLLPSPRAHFGAFGKMEFVYSVTSHLRSSLIRPLFGSGTLPSLNWRIFCRAASVVLKGTL